MSPSSDPAGPDAEHQADSEEFARLMRLEPSGHGYVERVNDKHAEQLAGPVELRLQLVGLLAGVREAAFQARVTRCVLAIETHDAKNEVINGLDAPAPTAAL